MVGGFIKNSMYFMWFWSLSFMSSMSAYWSKKYLFTLKASFLQHRFSVAVD